MRPYRAGRRRSAIHRGTLLAALLLTGSLSIGVSSASAAVLITKSASATESYVGENVHFALTVTNTGALPATATVRDTLPPNFTYVSAIGAGCFQAPVNTLRCEFAVPASQSETVVIVASGDSPGAWSNQASATSGTVTTDSNIVSGVILPRDSDRDGVADELDNCPRIANPGQANTDGDAQGDACDADDDNDGVGDNADQCEGTTTGTAVAADGCADPDSDGISTNAGDNCPDVANPGQANTDGDGQGDACDADDDNDGVGDDADQCEGSSSGTTVAADGCADPDGDGISTTAGDNCPNVANPDQADTDGDAQGDACDADDDNDNVADAADNCQFTANPDQQDLDGDGIGTACDPAELPTDKEQCKNGGWKLFYDLNGPRFKSQGDCVSFVQRGPR
jgi:uncharacterized repeat protein (TIGR01451 family)